MTKPLNPIAVEQVDLLHRALFGWPVDHLTPLAELVASASSREIACKIIASERFRWDIRGVVPLWPHNKWVCTEAFGLRIWVNLNDGYVSWGVLHEKWENDEVGFVLSHLRPGDAFVDIGANVGVYTLQAARAVGPAGHVYSVEPRPDTCAMLGRSIADNGFSGRCTVFNVAVGDAETSGSLNTRHDPLNPGATYISTEEDGAVRVRTLDSLPIASDRPVKVLKMDIEGYEPLMMAGAPAFFRTHRPIIVTEFFPRAIRAAARCDAECFFDQLAGLDYKTSHLASGRLGSPLQRTDLAALADIVEPITVACIPASR